MPLTSVAENPLTELAFQHWLSVEEVMIGRPEAGTRCRCSSGLNLVSHVDRTLLSLDHMHQGAQFIDDPLLHWQPMPTLENWSNGVSLPGVDD